jgi:tetraacyldisaccharide 4'-kinase
MSGLPGFWRETGVLTQLLAPLSHLFGYVAARRRQAYAEGRKRIEVLPVPVIVVGNISVGGSGKTPAVEWLIDRLRTVGLQPGIISRGYGGEEKGPALVKPDDDPARVGDEPLLLAQRCQCPVAICADRIAAGRLLLAQYPHCDVIVSDDGLQHYRLHRDVEIAVVNQRVLGNQRLLPAGPLREPVVRLAGVDAVFAHGPLAPEVLRQLGRVPVFEMSLSGQMLKAVVPPGQVAEERPVAHFSGRRVHAVAGIGDPERFFAQLRAQGIDVIPHPFPDHHRFSAQDLQFGDDLPCLMTSKDAVKCRSFAVPDMWEWPVTAVLECGAERRILEKVRHGR